MKKIYIAPGVWQHIRHGLYGLVLFGFGASSFAQSVPSSETNALSGQRSAVSPNCPTLMDDATFTDETQLRAMMTRIMNFGELRSPASDSHEQVVDWAESELKKIEGMEVRSDFWEIQRWQPTPHATNGAGRSLEHAGRLMMGSQSLPVAGAVPYSLGTSEEGNTGSLVYLPRNKKITADHAGKVIVRPFPNAQNSLIAAPPYLLMWLFDALYITPDMYSRVFQRYDRPFLGAGIVNEDLIAAGQVGAAAIVFTFDVPSAQMRDYWDPHNGIHYRLPALFVGVDEAEALKKAAAEGKQATVTVLAERDTATTRNLIATLPGQSDERIVFIANTDGNTWVQENGVAGLLALANYFGRQPLSCRPRTLEFAFNSAHLHMSREGTVRYTKELDADYDKGTVAFAFAIEHLGTRELLPQPRNNAASGRQVAFSGKGEPLSWFVANEHKLMKETALTAIKNRQLDSTMLLQGVALPSNTVPVFCSFGGIGSITHSALIPTMALISGPWSLWAPSFGADAVDFTRMRQQLLAVGDAVLALDDLPSEDLAGPYPGWREQREQGAPICAHPELEGSENAP